MTNTTFKIKATNDPKVVEKILSLCRRKLYKIKSVNADVSADGTNIILTLMDLGDKKMTAQKMIRKIVEVIEINEN